MSTALLDFNALGISDPDLKPMRQALYRSDGPGYVLIKQFLSPELAEHVAGYWLDTPPASNLFDTTMTSAKVVGQKSYIFEGNHRTCYHNYLWNRPMDEVSHSTCFLVTMLRNQLEQQPLHRFLLPGSSRMASYRVLCTDHVDGVEVEEHTDDWLDNSGKMSDRSMKYLLQATLFLTEYGKDYDGDGFKFYSNTGERLSFGPDINVGPGDLLLWRYSNRHGVDANRKRKNGRGFARIVFPYEEVSATPLRPVKQPLLQATGVRFEKIFRGLSKRRLKAKFSK